MTEDELVGCHHQLNGHEFEQGQRTVRDREAWTGGEVDTAQGKRCGG